jgi:hypothetical protein
MLAFLLFASSVDQLPLRDLYAHNGRLRQFVQGERQCGDLQSQQAGKRRAAVAAAA